MRALAYMAMCNVHTVFKELGIAPIVVYAGLRRGTHMRQGQECEGRD